MNRKLFFAWLCIFSSNVVAQVVDDSLMIRRIANEILENSTAYFNLRTLTKEVGPRLSGSPGMYKAEAWAQKALKTAGADSVWLQQCLVPHWVRGAKETAYFQAGRSSKKESLEILALGNSAGSGPSGVQGQVMLINNFEELEQRKDEVKGKIVFINYKFNNTYVKTFQAYGDASRYRAQGPSRAAKYGAIGVLVRSMSHSTDNFPHTGGMSYNDSFPKIPAAAVGLKDADKLAAAVTMGDVKLYFRTNSKMLADTIAHNVIGEIRGTEFPDRYITIGGHLDSWDPAEGAHDDGAGCVHSIELLRALKAIGYKPRHTIRVVLFANEENGLRGGNKYAEEAKARNEKHVFALESDAGGFTPRGFGFTMGDEQLRKLRAYLPLFLPYGVYEFNAGGGGADIGPLNRSLGVPIAGLQPDSQRYFDLHHARNDVFEAVNKRELELGAVNMTALIYIVDRYGM